MSGCPVLAAPAGFNSRGLPMGIQIVAPMRREFACLQLAYAYETASGWTRGHEPPLLVSGP
jgi:amidase